MNKKYKKIFKKNFINTSFTFYKFIFKKFFKFNNKKLKKIIKKNFIKHTFLL